MKNTDTATKKPKAVLKPAATPKITASPAPEESQTLPEKVEMSTDVFSKEVLTELKKREKQIKSCIGKIDSSFETIAFNLYWINSKEAYKAEGCDSIVKYSEEMFGYAKSTCYSLISVVDRFAKRDDKGAILEELDSRVKGYSVSKLSLMVGLTDDQIERLKPDMSVRDIKKFVKSLEGKAIPDLSEGNGEEEEENTAEDTSSAPANVVESTAREIIRNTIISYKGVKDYEKKIDYENIAELVTRVLTAHPDAVIEISYTLPDSTKGE